MKFNEPIETKADVYEYLRTWFKKTDIERQIIYKEKEYYQILGFKRAFQVHSVFYQLESNEYFFNCSDDINPLVYGKFTTYHEYC